MGTRTKKLSDEHFWDILAKNAGLYQRTANAIAIAIGQPYARQTVFKRANMDKERLHQIREANIDIAESGLHYLMRLKDNPGIRMRAIEFFLKTQGKHRGYTEQKDISLTNVPTINIVYDGGHKSADDEDILG